MKYDCPTVARIMHCRNLLTSSGDILQTVT